ncbi:uncharacterized protein LOC119629244 [Bombyx mori]|uniref:Endonuclease-reverse transcriptase n=1 Tax=Bombyx mori TaxID=7091 RepID=A0A8R2R087_BOMMO|nr:uncharacterized protein LOC119629244 [Bombyx mori]
MDEQFELFFEKIKTEMKNQSDSITSTIMEKIGEKLEPVIEENKKLRIKVELLEKKIETLERDKKNNNIIVHGLKEGEKTTEQLLKNTKEVFLKTLNINIQDCEINKIYRIGKEIKGNKPRPTLLSFVSGLKKNEILRNKKKSKEITFTEDYSKDILEKRKALIPQLTEERNKGKIAYLKYDQLIVKEKSNTYYEKRKREVSTSPQYSQPKKQQISSSSKEIVNVYDMMRARSNSLTSTTCSRDKKS